MPSPIRHQVRLPLSVAFGVVTQGIRIRLGRSLVTLAGVVLGIAFLMSILTGQEIRRGVAAETAMRQEMKRMRSFLVAETGPLEERVLGVVQCGSLSPAEARFLQELAAGRQTRLNWVRLGNAGGEAQASADGTRLQPVPLAEVGAEASAVVVLGAEALPPEATPALLLAGARQRVLAVTAANAAVAAAEDVSLVRLDRDLPEEERLRLTREQTKARFRTGWIIVISLLVTVIGISNAMLMSVTERFREIGTMKCLGALSGFVRQLFFIESSLMGLAGSLLGGLLGAGFAWLAFALMYGAGLVGSALHPPVLLGYFALCVAAGVVLSIVAAIYPASFASRMVPATALRSTI